MTAITIPDKVTTDSLTASEFNQLLDALKDGTKEITTELIVVENPTTNAWDFVSNKTTTIVGLGKEADTTATNWFYRNVTSATSASPVVLIEQDNSSDDQDALSIQNDGTGFALSINQNGNDDAINISVLDARGGGSPAILINDQSSTEQVHLMRGSGSTGSNYFYRNLGSADTAGSVVFIKQDNASDDQNALNIQQDGSGIGLEIDQNGDGRALYIDTESTTKDAAYIYSNNIRTAGSLIRVWDNNASSTANTVNIQNVGTGDGIFINQDGNGIALNIDSEATTSGNPSLNINIGTGSNIQLGRSSSLSDGSNWFLRNLSSTSTGGPVVKIEQSNTGDDQNALTIQNDGTGDGLLVDQNGNGRSLFIDSEATSKPLVGLAPINGNSRGDIAFSTNRTGDPSSPNEGDMWYNSTTNQFKGYNGTSVVVLG